MKEYFALLPDYLARCAQRVDLCVGIVAGIVFFIIASISGLGRVTVPITMAIILLAALEAGYNIYREERIMRAERDAKVRLIASPGSISWNHPDPGPGKVSLKTHVYWEIWTDIDINTAQIGLNIVGIRNRTWWQIFRRREQRLKVLWPKGQTPPSKYRKTFQAADSQPIIDDAKFEYEGSLDWSDKDGLFGLELVLVTGSPAGTYRAYVDPRLWERGSSRPL